MKNKLLTLSILSFALFSCSNEDEVQVQQKNDEAAKAEIMNIISNATEKTTQEMEEEFFRDNNYVVVNPEKSNNIVNSIKANNTPIHGPYTTTISATPAGVLPNQKIIWKGYEYPAAAAYVADVNTHSVNILLPDGAFGFVNSMTNQGYNDYGAQTQGYSFSNVIINGKNYLNVRTYTMKIRWNMAGQAINANVPSYGFGAKSVSYSYITP
ncbi:hypothetical protein SAMN05421741_12347 [Paenimyroides ummariense]|uniref:DUF4251 domain-containing protein n=1 Tax=Paenimyroides ummariense TaxID=913024 RepID=A0A1I5EZG9_9FLAO|nr:hypothetical protein [Paenimyroides ummariense]SFO16780.1 hypothetical protein SAMN05421741_12347 [Paenimyroides ummariense]